LSICLVAGKEGVDAVALVESELGIEVGVGSCEGTKELADGDGE
jgi:hypothetical protein